MDRYEHARAIIRAHERDDWHEYIRLTNAYLRRFPPPPPRRPAPEVEWIRYRVVEQTCLFMIERTQQ